MGNAIHTPFWDLLTPKAGSNDWMPGRKVLAIWPAPVNSDACFAAAGFDDFDDPDDRWDGEWRGVIERLLGYLGRFGPPRAARSPAPCEQLPALQRFKNLLRGRPGSKKVELTIIEQVETAAREDQFGDLLLMFGNGPYARLRAGDGHALLLVQIPELTLATREDILRDAAGDHPLARRRLDWSNLVDDLSANGA